MFAALPSIEMERGPTNLGGGNYIESITTDEAGIDLFPTESEVIADSFSCGLLRVDCACYDGIVREGITMQWNTSQSFLRGCFPLLNRYRLVLFAGIFGSLLFNLAGCTTAPKTSQSRRVGVSLVSRNGVSLFQQAKQRYVKVRARDLQGDELTQEMSNVLKLIDGAMANDPRCVLFHAKQAQMYLESGQINRAYSGYDKSRGLSQDWVPAWIGMADVTARKGEYRAARSHLASAQKALDKIQGNTKKEKRPPDFFEIIGLNIPRKAEVGPDAKDPNDPSLSEDDALRLQVVWLQESESWTIENPGLLSQGGGRTTVQDGNLFRRLRARIEYHHALIDRAEGKQHDEIVKRLDYSLQWDPNFFPSKIELAVMMRQQGQYQAAERLIKPYVDSPEPVLANNGRLLMEMASLYTDWFKKTKEASLADQADIYFDRLHKLNKSHAAGYIKRAELYLAAGSALNRADTLRTGIACLDAAKQSLGKETTEIVSLRTSLNAALTKAGG